MRSGPGIGRGFGGALALLAAACTGDRTVTLGDTSPRPYHFEAPTLVAELEAISRTDNPTLTADELEIYFTSSREGGAGNGDIWFASRAARGLPFGPPAPLTGVNLDSFETSAAISADGLTLWFGSDRAGGVGGSDIWVTTRATRTAPWSTPGNVVALNTAADDIPRPPGQHGLVMPLASTVIVPRNYQTFLAQRPAPGAPFGKPVLIEELAFPERSTVDGALSDDGLTLFYSSTPLAPPGVDAAADVDGGASPRADLYVAWRRLPSDAFSVTQPLDELNTAGDERDPWLSADGRTLYFTSDRGGVLSIYTAAVKPR